MNNELEILPCLDSAEMGRLRQRELRIQRSVAAALGASAVIAAMNGYYLNSAQEEVVLGGLIQTACANKISIAPDDDLPDQKSTTRFKTQVQVANETTLGAARRLTMADSKPLALNFANGVQPGGGFLNGALAQEEVLCRSSALFSTLSGDSMYRAHSQREQPDSSSWAIYSPSVPVFRTDDGQELDEPWLLSFITCAAPYAPAIGQPRSGDLLQERIQRVLQIAQAYGYKDLVLGAWGCGAFGNDVQRTAEDFRRALETDFKNVFSHIVFAVTDWSPERKFLGPFREAFS